MIELLVFMHQSLWTYFGTLFYTIVVGWLLISLVNSLKNVVNVFKFYEAEDGEWTKEQDTAS